VESPHLSELQERYGSGKLAVLAVHIGDAKPAQIQKLVADKKLKQRVLIEGRPVARDYGVAGLPTTFFIDSDGVIREVEVGFNGAEALERQAAALVARKS